VIDRPAELLCGTLRHACTVIDISSGGAQITITDRVTPLTSGTLRLDPIGSLLCRVVWVQQDRVGLRFLHDAGWVTSRLKPLLESAA
jgi:hypothetical protein